MVIDKHDIHYMKLIEEANTLRAEVERLKDENVELNTRLEESRATVAELRRRAKEGA